jgi:hypothetical protein
VGGAHGACLLRLQLEGKGVGLGGLGGFDSLDLPHLGNMDFITVM